MNSGGGRRGEVVLRATGLRRSYFKGAEVPVLRGVDIEVRRAEFTAIVGASGSGKTTLLHVMGTLDQPDAGEIYWRDVRLDQQSERFRDRFRNRTCGFVFQFYHLLPELSALENVLLPKMIELSPLSYWRRRGKLFRRAEELLDRVGLARRMSHRPAELSGGEMQRTAIARALMAEPEILFADEPTGNLDAETGRGVFELLDEIRREDGLTLLLATHDAALAQRADRVLRLENGILANAAEGRARAAAVAG
jgi:lipoprotein-releasing system ATP-binding protein